MARQKKSKSVEYNAYEEKNQKYTVSEWINKCYSNGHVYYNQQETVFANKMWLYEQMKQNREEKKNHLNINSVLFV